MRERVPLVFMTVSVAATLALGGAIAYEFAHPSHTTAAQPAAASTTLQPTTGAVKGKTHSSGSPANSSSGSVVASGSPTAQKASASLVVGREDARERHQGVQRHGLALGLALGRHG
jgi:FlaG/FlaF family flagellin (archaellin)